MRCLFVTLCRILCCHDALRCASSHSVRVITIRDTSWRSVTSRHNSLHSVTHLSLAPCIAFCQTSLRIILYLAPKCHTLHHSYHTSCHISQIASHSVTSHHTPKGGKVTKSDKIAQSGKVQQSCEKAPSSKGGEKFKREQGATAQLSAHHLLETIVGRLAAADIELKRRGTTTMRCHR